MKKTILSVWLSCMLAAVSYSQQIHQKGEVLVPEVRMDKNVPELVLATPDLEQIRIEDEQRDRNGQLYRIGVATFANITTQNSGLWKTLPNGDRKWQIQIKSSGAEALSFLFEVFKLYDNSSLTIQDMSGVHRHRPLTAADVEDHYRQNAALCFGDEFVLTLTEPAGSRPSEIFIDRVMYNYRSTGNPMVLKINESDNCEVNVNCSPVGDTWQDEKRGVARIYVVDGASAGWCTGSLVNNVAQNCKPLFLTALHCGVTSTTANFTQWRFYFKYESPNCTNPGTAGTLDDYYITGSVKLASSNDGGGDTGSDFLLVQLGSLANEATTITTLKTANYNAYWNGWDANNTTTNLGANIHHPAGDIKKISTFSTNLVNATWGGTAGTHWRVQWSSNANGWGVTEGGSSGSPIFKDNSGSSVICGTLTGGASYCTAQTANDYFGKMSYHWTSNGTAANEQLKTYLDPASSGTMLLLGSADPCSAPTVPVADFVADQTTVSPGGTVTFTDLTTGIPNTWSWTITPGTAGVDWSYTGGTSSASQNPQVIFNTVGQYTIALTASNGSGSDTETKTNYITVAVSTDPCTATSSTCDEYISNVLLSTINNTTACTNYGDYTSISTTLNKGVQYIATISPYITGTGAGAYTDDEIAIWIDWNDDLDFTDAGEQVGYVLVASGWSNQFTFTVPLTATTGTVNMRVRLSYLPDDGTIAPCGDTQWGEVEDYSIVVQDAPSGTLTLSCGPNESMVASVDGTTMPNLTADATASTTCPGGAVTVTQSPLAGSALSNGVNNVTITATDNCGNTETCTVTVTYENDLGLDENSVFSVVSIYPNPFNNELLIDLSSIEGQNVFVEVYDLTGKLLTKGSNEEQSVLKFDMTNFAKGMYQVRLFTSNEQTIKKVTKL